MSLVQTGIPVEVVIDGEARTAVLPTGPIMEWIKSNRPALIDPAADHSFGEQQVRTGLKSMLRFVMGTYVKPMTEQTGYPKFDPDRKKDYIDQAMFYALNMLIDILSVSGGISVVVDGDEIAGIEWKATENQNQLARPLGDIGDVGNGQNDIREEAPGDSE